MQAYIAISYAGRKGLQEELEAICNTLVQSGINPFVFVDQYLFPAEEEKTMMQEALKEIDRSDILIAAASEKAIGIGIEAGYAKGKGKPVIYIRHQNAEHSTTLSGISDDQIIYVDLQDLAQKLQSIVKQWLP